MDSKAEEFLRKQAKELHALLDEHPYTWNCYPKPSAEAVAASLVVLYAHPPAPAEAAEAAEAGALAELELIALELLAAEATPGPWVVWENHADVYASTPDLENTPSYLGGVRMKVAACEFDDQFDFMGTDEELASGGPYNGEANAAYIAALSPERVLALIARVRAAEAAAPCAR